MSLLNKLNGWCRAALVFSLSWIAVVLALLLYEPYITLSDATSKYAVLSAAVFDYHPLLFYVTYTTTLISIFTTAHIDFGQS